jgi:hypothetical protein
MRNHASAAHPDQVDLTGLQLASWLETCIRQVITLRRTRSWQNTGRLLRNIKADQIDAASEQSLRSRLSAGLRVSWLVVLLAHGRWLLSGSRLGRLVLAVARLARMVGLGCCSPGSSCDRGVSSPAS